MTWIITILSDVAVSLSWWGPALVAALVVLALSGAFTPLSLRLEERLSSSEARGGERE